jgi:3-deoxy-manno-octulosonate cytidylyltransferase (CMP-KDO synthetase)
VNLAGTNSQNTPSNSAVAVIPARWASTRLPGKALIEIAGKPMVCWVAERARAAKNISRVIVATDNPEVLRRVKDYGIEVVMTDASHASGTDRVGEVARNLPDAEVVVNVQGDEPMISPETIESAVDAIFSDPNAGIVTTWEPIESLDQLLNFDTVKVVVGDDGYALYFSRSPMPFPRDAYLKHGDPNVALDEEPQLWPNYRKHTGLYVYRRDVLLEFTGWPQTTLERYEGLEQLRALEHGIKIRLIQASGSSIGVDTATDLERVKALVEEGKFQTVGVVSK